MPKTILITGGAGFIGSNLAGKLLSEGYKVRVLDNMVNGKQANIDCYADNPNYEFILGDIRNMDDCRKACKGVDAISHQAALGSVPRSIKNPATTNDVNIGGFVNMLFAAVEEGIKRFVFASSSSVYGDEKTLPKVENKIGKPLSPYAVTKFTNEVYADVFSRTYDIELIGFRYFNIFGPRQDPEGEYAAVMPLFIKSVINNTSPFINGDGEQSRDFTFVENAVSANILGLTTQNPEAVNQIYNIAVGERFTVNQMFNDINAYLGKDVKPIYREPREGDIRDSLADISKAEKLLGYRPLFTFKQGLPLTIEYFKGIFK